MLINTIIVVKKDSKEGMFSVVYLGDYLWTYSFLAAEVSSVSPVLTEKLNFSVEPKDFA